MAGRRRGLDLAGAFYREAVAPLLGDIAHAAALLGWGSDVLGFDTERSTDHGWGPRLQVFVAPADVELVRRRVDGGLPAEFAGLPVRFGWDEVPVAHHVEVAPLGDWLEGRLGFDPTGGVALRDWLATPQQRLLEVTAGAVFHDDDGALAAVRTALAWYPDDVWLWLIGCQWLRVDREEPFVGRAAEVGDELGSRLVAARLARDLMRLAFLLERRYAPYSKWLGSAFARLDAAASVGPALETALAAESYAARESGLVAALEELARRHNSLGLTPPLDPATRAFYERPYRVLFARRFAAACLERVVDPRLRALPPLGAIDQHVDSTEALADPSVFRALSAAAGGS